MKTHSRTPPFFKITFLLFVFLAANSALATKPCGAFNIIEGVKSLNQTDFIRAKNDFGSGDNGKSLSVFGWVRLEDTSARQHNLMRMVMVGDKTNGTIPATFADFARIVYDSTDLAKPKLTISSAFDEKDIKSETFSFVMPQKTWLFMTFTFDYGQDIVALHIKGRDETTGEAINFFGELKVAFRGFVIPQNMELDIGCFPKASFTAVEKADILKTCMRGSIRDFSLMLEYTKTPTLAYMLRALDNSSSVLFKLTDSSNQILNTPFIIESQGLNVTLTARQMIADSGKSTIFELPNLGALSTGDFFTGMTMYTEMTFMEGLPDNYLFMAQRLNANDTTNHMEMRMIKEASNGLWKMQVSFPPIPAMILTSDALMTPGKKHRMALGLSAYLASNIAAIIEIDGVVKTFEGAAPKALQNGPMSIFTSSMIKVATFGIIPNTAGVAFSVMRDASWKNSPCFDKCQLANSMNFGPQKCMACNEGWVSAGGKCGAFCPKGFYGLGGTCIKCEQQTCAQLQLSRFFTIKKTSPTTFIVTPAKTLIGFNDRYGAIITPSVSGAKMDVDYTMTINTVVNSTATYTFAFNGNNDWKTSEVVFEANPTPTVYDSTGTLVQGKPIAISYGVEFSNEFQSKATSDMPAGFADEFVNAQAEDDVSKLAIATFAIFLFGMLIGLIGLSFRCRFVTPSPFFYQKVIQSFLIFNYIVFWLMYNSQFPRNLLSFLKSLFRYSINYHQIFNKATMDNFGGETAFTEHWSFLGSWRFMGEGVLNSFVLNFGLIFIIQGAFLFLYLTLRIIWGLMSRSRSQSYSMVDGESPSGTTIPHFVPNSTMTRDEESTAPLMQRLVQLFEWKLIMTLFAMFVTETTVFALYNMIHYNFDHPFWTFSFAWSVIYFSMVTLLIFGMLIISLLPPSTLHVETFAQRFGFIYEGFQNGPAKRCFQGLQYLHYFIFAIFLVAAFPERLVQIIPNLVFMTLLMCLTFVRAPKEKFDKIEQMIVHIFLWLAKLFLSAIVIDDTALIMTGEQRWILGYVVLITIFVIICWNTFVIVYKFIVYWEACAHFGSEMSMNKMVQLPGEEKSLKSSLPPAMLADVDGSNRIIGFDQDKNQLFLTSRADVTSGIDINTGTKRTIQLDNYIEAQDSKRQVSRKDNDALTFANSNAYLNGKGQANINSQINVPDKQAFNAKMNLVQSAPNGEPMNHLASQRFSEKVVSNGKAFQESHVQNNQMPSQRDNDVEAKLQSLKNLGSVRNNLATSQQQEVNMEIGSSYTSDRFQPVEPLSVKELPKGENFAKKKEAKMTESKVDAQNIIIEESNNPDSFFEKDKKGSSKNFFES